VQSQDLVKNRILRQLSADELKSVQPWLTPVGLRSNAVLHEPGDAIEQVYFPLSGMGLRRNVPGGGKRVAGTGAQAAVDPQIAIMPPLTEGQNRINCMRTMPESECTGPCGSGLVSPTTT
jgi:hypothetical protein